MRSLVTTLLIGSLSNLLKAQTVFSGGTIPQNYARDLVNPFVGTGGHGHTFPGACVPNGLVQLSPDTRPDGYMDWDGCGGYHHSDSLIYGFSHTHLSGTGVADLCDVLVTPMNGRYSFDPKHYRSDFSHVKEAAHAGYYRVHLDDPDVDVELTATAHAGMHRYDFKSDKGAYIVLDLLHRDKLLTGSIDPRTPTEVTGERRSSSWAGDQRLFYCIRFNKPMQDYVMSDKGSDRTGGMTDRPDTAWRAAFFFGDLKGEPLLVKVGISAVSVEGARNNLMSEIPGWDFDAVRQQAEDAWNAKLSKIQVSGGTHEQQRIFYTALYHCYVAPYLFSDVDGNYRGMDGEVHRADHKVYTVFSLWDTFRALHPLMTILEPEMTNDFIKTFLLNYQQGGKLPVWELWGNETNCMIGYHSVSVIADAYLKGIRGYDAELALEAMVASAMADDPCLNAYRTRGYISSEDCAESVSKTLEYAYDDWCIAQMASEMGRDSLADVFYKRSRNWQNLFDPKTKFFRPRRNGGFIEPFDPYEVNFHYTEANAWQYAFFVPHDVMYFSELLGGDGALANELDTLFNANTSTSGRDQADITGLIGQYAHGNEPSHHMAALYAEGFDHSRGEAIAYRILGEQYHNEPDGLSGNEDCGQMSTWFVMNSIGLYQTCPGRSTYTVSVPLFDSITIRCRSGDLRVIATHASSEDRYLSGMRLGEGETIAEPFIGHESLRGGGAIDLTLSNAEDPWGHPSRALRNLIWEEKRETVPPVPIILGGSATFRGEQTITLASVNQDLEIQYCIGPPGKVRCQAQTYRTPFTIDSTCDVQAWCVGVHERSATVTAHFTKIDGSRKLKLTSTYANQYSAGGPAALIDGLRGGRDFRTGEWQGYQGQDVVATVDLGEVKKLKRAGVSALQDMKSWIWYPASVLVEWSADGKEWSSHRIDNTVDRRTEGGLTQELWTDALDARARYVRITAANAGPCPDWHPGKGGSTWIFLDEVLVETE